MYVREIKKILLVLLIIYTGQIVLAQMTSDEPVIKPEEIVEMIKEVESRISPASDYDMPPTRPELTDSTNFTPPPKISTGRSGKPIPKLFMNISVNNTEPRRGEIIQITYNITCRNASRVAGRKASASNIEIYTRVPAYLKLINVTQSDKYRCEYKNDELNIYSKKLEEGESICTSYEAEVSCSAELSNYSLKNNIVYKTMWGDKMRYLTIENNPNIKIDNNKPEIDFAEIVVVSPCIWVKSREMQNILSPRDHDDPIKVKFKVSANDKEDGTNLTYKWQISDSARDGNTKPEYTKTLGPSSEPEMEYVLEDISTNKSYYFHLIVTDRDSGINESDVNVSYYYDESRNPIILNHIEVPPREQYQYTAFFLIPFLIIILIIYMYILQSGKLHVWLIKLWNKLCHKINYDLLSLLPILIIIILSYIILYRIEIYSLPYSHSEEFTIYFRSFAFFIVFIYAFIFTLFIYFLEICFGGIAEADKNRLHIFNSAFMIIIMLVLVMIIPEMDPDLLDGHLHSYYTQMAGTFGAILAIVMAIYKEGPKNIINVSAMGDPKIEDKDKMYPYQATIHRFVLLYGLIIILSLLGLSAGTSARLDPIIFLDYNLFSLFVLATTLMLIPPAITSLYELLRLILRRGVVTIKCDPEENGKIFLNGHDTGLTTPNKLFIIPPKQNNLAYKIEIKTDKKRNYQTDYETKEIQIYEGTENEYTFRRREEV